LLPLFGMAATIGTDAESQFINHKRCHPTDPLQPLLSVMSLLIFVIFA
jgi:hypothetical protein